MESGSRAVEFEELTVDSGSNLLPDMTTDASGEHIYAVSSNKVRLFIKIFMVKCILSVPFFLFKKIFRGRKIVRGQIANQICYQHAS